MADLTEPEPEEVVPDLTDLAYVTVNVETTDERQYSIVIAAEDESLEMAQEQGYGADDRGDFRTWTFTVRQTTPKE